MEPVNASCANCGKIWPLEELEEPKHLWQRLDPGDEVPAGECPECYCLCYLIPFTDSSSVGSH